MSDRRAPKDWKKVKGKKGLSPDGPEAKTALDAIRAGNYVTVACIAAGISYDTYRRWMKIGKIAADGPADEEHVPFARFYLGTRQAMADAELALQSRIDSASRVEWQAAAWLLERRHHKRWGKRLDTKGEVTVKSVELPHNLALLPAELVRPYLQALAAMEPDPAVRQQYEEAAEALEGATS